MSGAVDAKRKNKFRHFERSNKTYLGFVAPGLRLPELIIARGNF